MGDGLKLGHVLGALYSVVEGFEFDRGMLWMDALASEPVQAHQCFELVALEYSTVTFDSYNFEEFGAVALSSSIGHV